MAYAQARRPGSPDPEGNDGAEDRGGTEQSALHHAMPGRSPDGLPPRVRLSGEQYRTVVDHCRARLPEEACGLLVGPTVDGTTTGEVTVAACCVNVARSASRYEVDPRDLVATARDAEAAGHEIVGVWHSHPTSPGRPSGVDVQDAYEHDWLYVIVGFEDPDRPDLRAWQIPADGRPVQLEVLVRP